MSDQEEPKERSALRLRVGVIMFLIWWLPVYLMVPAIISSLGLPNSSDEVFRVTLAVVLVQSAIGIVGLLLVGKQITVLLKHTSYKKLPKTVWHLFWSGQLPE